MEREGGEGGGMESVRGRGRESERELGGREWEVREGEFCDKCW